MTDPAPYNSVTKEYDALLMKLAKVATVWEADSLRQDRTGVGTYSLFGEQVRFPLSYGTFPILTKKYIHWKSVVAELLWFMSGDTNVKTLQRQGVTIWNEWANEEGELGPVYGAQWRNFNGVDQLAKVVNDIKTNPTSRRHIVSAWNAADIDKMALPPCHVMFQFLVDKGNLTCIMTQRSADVFLGLPFNIASYALLTHIIAQHCGLTPHELVINIGDAHLYQNHVPAALTYLKRVEEVTPNMFQNRIIPFVQIAQKCSVFEHTPGDILLKDYVYDPAIKAPIAV